MLDTTDKPAIRRRRAKAGDTNHEASTVEADASGAADAETAESQPANDATAQAIATAPSTLTDSPAPEGREADAATSSEAAESPARPAKPAKSAEELRKEKRVRQTTTARDQRKRHRELLEEWMPTQRGAVIAITTKIGHQAVESWFKRTFLKNARMLWKIHTFPRVKLTYEDIGKIEQSCLDAITKCETKLNATIAQLDALIDQSAMGMAFYQKFYSLDVMVSTRTATRLHGIYLKADELALRLDTLSLNGLITPEREAKALSSAHNAVFGLCAHLEQLYTSLYVRTGTAAPALKEDDGAEAVSRGEKPDDQLPDAAPAEAAPADAQPVAPTAEAPEQAIAA